MSRKWLLTALCACFFALPTQAALLLDLQPGGATDVCGTDCAGPTTYGWSFTLTSTVTALGIGVFDAGSDGIGTSTAVGLFTAGGTLLGSATITDGSTVVASASGDGQWLVENFGAPIVLNAGSYLIGNVFTANSPSARLFASTTMAPGATLNGGAVGTSGGGLTAPITAFGTAVFGPTLVLQDFSNNVDTPEPGTVGLVLVGLALAGLSSRRARR